MQKMSRPHNIVILVKTLKDLELVSCLDNRAKKVNVIVSSYPPVPQTNIYCWLFSSICRTTSNSPLNKSTTFLVCITRQIKESNN